ncbi:cell division protein FtsL [Luminiphilus syltensis]|uniref:cell division protein FtsL n=1 Tax=Luminiphilus syltensis TaxID=1341119 RepID=UPI0002D2B246|nr:cell division protein FtsL [Luminiphilus syltensis]
MIGAGRSSLGIALVVTVNTVSALALVYSSHVCRQYYAQLQHLEQGRWALEEDFSRLLIERSTLASPHRVYQVATNQLDMAPPPAVDILVVAP